MPRDIRGLPAVPGRAALLPSRVPASAVVAPARRPGVAAYRLLVALAAAAAVTIDLVLGSAVRVLSDFAIQSNILLALVLAASARRAWTARHPLPPLVTGAALLYALITGLAHHFLLTEAASTLSLPGGTTDPTGWQAISAQILHTVTPIAAALDWLLLTSPGHLRLRQAPTWLLYPLAYLAFSLVRGELIAPGTPGRYLYPLLDVDHHGYKSALGNALLLSLSLYALAALLVAIDHMRPNPRHHSTKTGFRLQPPVG
ncbi:integral membrane regulator [Streptomyces sp. HUCO-GS316]|nr:integral membrane regulator [Streptomyces sp. HUCO-GS316]